MSNVSVKSVRGAAGAALGRDVARPGLEETFTPSWGVPQPWAAPGRDAGLVVAEDEDDDMDDDESFGDDDEFEDDEGFEEDDEDFLEDEEEDLDGDSEEDDEEDDDDDL